MESLEIAIQNALKREPDAPKVRDSRDNREGHYVVAESTSASEVIFGTLGPMCHEQGWNVFPQQRTGRRLPSIYRKESIKWGQYFFERPSAELVGLWSHPCFNENVALILGPSSGNVIALDIDVKDWDFSDEIEQIAYDVLGHTPWKRIGRAPKKALFYRFATVEELPPSSSHTFVDKDGKSASGHMLEVLSEKRAITIYGRHHDTLARFGWAGSDQPAIASPLDVPLITRERFDAFLEAVQKHRAFHRNGGTVDLTVDLDRTGPVVRPRISGGGEWVEEGGLVVDGREKFLFHVAKELVRENAGLAQTDDGQRQLAGLVVEEFRKRARCDGRWQNPEREALLKVRGAAGASKEGRLAPRRRKTTILDNRKPACPAAASVISDGCQGALAWLPPASSRGEIKDVSFSEFRCDDEEFAKRQIPETAAETVARITTEVPRHLDSFFANIENATGHPRTRVELAPTGAGKTHMSTSAVERFHQNRGTEEDGSKAPFPVLMLTPTYKNIEETAAKARDNGISKVVEWMGKARCATLETEDRCIRGEELELMQKAGRNNAVLCEAKNPDFVEGGRNIDGDGNEISPTIRCTHFDTCRYQRQIREAREADLILAAHAYLSCPAPAALTDCKVVLIDESFHGQLIRSYRFPDAVLLYPRRAIAYRTKAEKEAGVEREAFDSAREELGVQAHHDLRRGIDPVRWFLTDDRNKSRSGKSVAEKREALEMTIALLSRTRDDSEITPDTGLEKIRRLCTGPERSFVHEEEKFWRLLRDRVDLDALDLLDLDGNPKTGTLPARMPSAKHDGRILWQRGETSNVPGEIRLSWVAEHNFPEAHILALDASADVSLVAKVLGRKESEVVCDPVDAMLRVRTVHVTGRSLSKTSLLPNSKDTDSYAAYKDRLTVSIRTLISHVAAMHPQGGIAVCMPQALKNHILDGWAAPERIVWFHYGYTRGFNFAEGCSAAVAIGCLNPSIQQLDDIVAALAHGEEQEPLRDPLGEHRGFDLERVYKTETIKLRNGHEMQVTQDATEGRYSEMALRQIRQEEHMQFLGRLRPVRRDEITAFYNVGSYIPPTLIVDEVVEFDDLVAWIGNAVEIAREHRGPIGAGETVEETKAATKFQKILDAGQTASAFFHVTEGGEVLYVPAHTPSILERLVEDGFEVTHSPELRPMQEFSAPVCSYADEVRLRDLSLAAAEKDGWKPTPGSRLWTRDLPVDIDVEKTNDKPPVALDVAVLAQHYLVRARKAEKQAEAEKLAAEEAAKEVVSGNAMMLSDDPELMAKLERLRTTGEL